MQSGGSYGSGLYFTDSITKAAQYHHGTNGITFNCVLVCRVILGDCLDIQSKDNPHFCEKWDRKQAPYKPMWLKRYRGDHLYHSWCGRRSHTSFTEFIVQHEDQVYPMYLVFLKSSGGTEADRDQPLKPLRRTSWPGLSHFPPALGNCRATPLDAWSNLVRDLDSCVEGTERWKRHRERCFKARRNVNRMKVLEAAMDYLSEEAAEEVMARISPSTGAPPLTSEFDWWTTLQFLMLDTAPPQLLLGDRLLPQKQEAGQATGAAAVSPRSFAPPPPASMQVVKRQKLWQQRLSDAGDKAANHPWKWGFKVQPQQQPLNSIPHLPRQQRPQQLLPQQHQPLQAIHQQQQHYGTADVAKAVGWIQMSCPGLVPSGPICAHSGTQVSANQGATHRANQVPGRKAGEQQHLSIPGPITTRAGTSCVLFQRLALSPTAILRAAVHVGNNLLQTPLLRSASPAAPAELQPQGVQYMALHPSPQEVALLPPCGICTGEWMAGEVVAVLPCCSNAVFHNSGDCFRPLLQWGTRMSGAPTVGLRCPYCGVHSGEVLGSCPSGTMETCTVGGGAWLSTTFAIAGGVTPEGERYHCRREVTYLPNTAQGQECLRLVEETFDLRHCFRLGPSVTHGAFGICWSSIPFKTCMAGGSPAHGYPDPGYLIRLKAQLQQVLGRCCPEPHGAPLAYDSSPSSPPPPQSPLPRHDGAAH